jgi:hypothetical protein
MGTHLRGEGRDSARHQRQGRLSWSIWLVAGWRDQHLQQEHVDRC